MLEIKAKDIAVEVLNSVLSKDDLDLDVMEALYIACELLDPQPELFNFYDILQDAYKRI